MTLQDPKTEEAAIRGLLDEFARALRAGDVDAMLSHCAPDVVAFDMLEPLQHEGAAALRAVWEETLAPFAPPLEHELAAAHARRFFQIYLAGIAGAYFV